MVSKTVNKTVQELKEICRQKNIIGYSKLKKEDLIKLVKKNSIRKNKKVKKSKKGGTNNNKLIRTDENIKTAVTEWLNGDKKEAINKYGHIRDWDTFKVTNMNYLFSIIVDRKIQDNYFNDDISNWNVSNVENMKGMFAGAIIFDQDLNNWNTSNVKDMESMFQTARSFNKNISDWNVSNVENMKGMFDGAVQFNQDLDKWNTSNVKDMVGMFQEAGSFNGNISNWNVSSVTTMGAMFKGAYEFNKDLNSWDVSNVIIMAQMFKDATKFNKDLNSWDVSNVISMALMFDNAESFNGNIGNWKVHKVMWMQNMFEGATSFNQPIRDWNVSTVTNMESMFAGATSFNQNISNWNIQNNTNFTNIFVNCNIEWRNIPQIIRMQIILSRSRPQQPNTSKLPLFINKNMLKSNNNTCNTKLYEYILSINNNILEDKDIVFKFEEQSGIDAGGLSRTVFDLFYKTYIHKFFKYSQENNQDLGMIIKYISSYENIKKFYHATKKLIILAKKANLQIFIPINETLLILLKSKNPIQEINLNKKNIYDKNQLLNNQTRKKGYENNTSKISDVLMKNNEKKNEKWNKNFSNITKNNEKKEVYFLRYLHSLKFEKDNHWGIMYAWMQLYWFNKDFDGIFTNKIPSYSKENFMKRIILKENENTRNLTNNILKNNSNTSIIKTYPNVKILLEYIINGTDENRKKFCNWATGSIFNNSVITITLNNSGGNTNIPFISHTCFNRIDVYQTNPNPLYKNINHLNAQISADNKSFHIE